MSRHVPLWCYIDLALFNGFDMYCLGLDFAQARLLSLHDDLISHAAVWSEAVAVHQAQIAERLEAFEEAK